MSLYMLRAGDSDRYKIGRTSVDAEDRRSGLSTGSAVPLVLIAQWAIPDGAPAFEAEIHALFAANRLHDTDATEFFEFRDSVMVRHIIDRRLEQFTRQRSEAAALSGLEQTSDDRVDPDDELDEWIAAYRRERASAKMTGVRLQALAHKIKQRIGERAGVGPGGRGRSRPMVTWKTQRKPGFDVKRFRAEHPELAAQYSTTVVSRPFVVAE